MLLLAEEPGELPVLSALVQDMAVRAADVAWEPRARRLTLLGNRFRHEAKGATRVRALLRFGGVLRAERRGWPADDVVLALLAVTADGDTLTLAFGGGAALRLSVECVDAVLEDVSGPWGAKRTPVHG